MNTTGFCGKMPQRGDFVSGRVPTTFTNTWEDWAQQLVNVCNTIKQQTNENPWFNLPVYRFYLSTGVAGENAWAGLMLPSSDSVGREYPFCLVRNIEPNQPPSEALALHQNFFQQAEELAKQLFSNKLDFTDLNNSLDQLDSATAVSTQQYNGTTISRQTTEAALCIKLTGPADTNDDTFWRHATAALLCSSCSAYSIWSTSPLSNTTQETLICEAMPSASVCPSLFDGEFNVQQWTLLAHKDEPPARREENIFTTDGAIRPSAQLHSNKRGDTKPIHKKNGPDILRETDFLELDDNDQTDAPWDD